MRMMAVGSASIPPMDMSVTMKKAAIHQLRPTAAFFAVAHFTPPPPSAFAILHAEPKMQEGFTLAQLISFRNYTNNI